jgi:hypothetical protein
MTFAGTNNTETFHPFITKLKEKCSDRKCIVVMDNLSVHKSKVIKTYSMTTSSRSSCRRRAASSTPLRRYGTY